MYRRGARHECSLDNTTEAQQPYHCQNCGAMRDSATHYCYIQPLWLKSRNLKGETPNDNPDPIRYIFFDVETTQTERIVVNGITVLFLNNFNLFEQIFLEFFETKKI